MVGHCGAREVIWEYSVETHCERAAGSINFYFRAADIPIHYVSDVREATIGITVPNAQW
jgi:hypothetical protein